VSTEKSEGSPFDLTGRVAVVTGGSRGIGKGMALGLARAGADIAIWARDSTQAEATAAEIRAVGVRAAGFACDVSNEEDVKRACASTLSELGRIDSCFANAGGGDGYNPLKVSMERWRKMLAVNLDGAFMTMRESARHMIERGGGGKLVAISSITEIFGAPKQAGYAASKGALGGLVRSLAIEFARHDIQVNNVQPGWIETDSTVPMREHEKIQASVLRRTPARRWGQPIDLAGIAVYLASDASNFHTGDTIRVDGGYSIV
jgi:NAD(P)-dependent dehydrogenase (short-subunit alcohol dehydrogenase family)